MELNYNKKNIRTAAALTTSYVEATVLEPQGIPGDPVENSQLVLSVYFTKGSLTSAEIKVEFSDDGVSYFQETNSAVSAGTSTLTLNEYKVSADGKYTIPINITTRFIKISCKGTGTVTGSSMAIDAVLAVRP